jgi:DNA-binding NtrC family response regulator
VSGPVVEELILGDSPAIRRMRGLIARLAPTSLPVLIEGPTGSGKELVAYALHAASGRQGRLVAFNVSAISETMFEDALFGHVRGAFTGATTDRRGYLAEANSGTAFLDEIGTLPLGAQAKLLRAIETKQFRPLGAREDWRSDFRVVAATNEGVDGLVRAGRFRADLAYRLNAVVVRVPSLRERLEDVPALARHFAASVAIGGGPAELSAGALALLQEHDWPGNVRQLRNVVECAVALSPEPLLTRAAVVAVMQREVRPHSEHGAGGFAARRLAEVLERFGWDTALVAEHLGVHRATVYRRMQRLGLQAPDAAALLADDLATPFGLIRANSHSPGANSREWVQPPDAQRTPQPPLS